ncbi:protein SDA1 [Artemisia annua]|uniref:Protein SDA1 n=1 Tax=Artemisia annua TaxID=35608 RepID=A0A2U1L9E0_ARTAN|nr:protein SDA1 [Artemisia annua]
MMIKEMKKSSMMCYVLLEISSAIILSHVVVEQQKFHAQLQWKQQIDIQDLNINIVESLVSPHLQPENEVSKDEDDSGSDNDADDVKCIDGMSTDSHGRDKVRGQKRKFVVFDDQIASASQSLRALKRLARAKSEFDDTSGAKVENEDTSDVTDGILSNEDFQRIKQLKANIRKRMTKEERKALIKAGREDSVKYQSKAAVKQKKTGVLSNKQKEHKKAMPIAAKRSKIEDVNVRKR